MSVVKWNHWLGAAVIGLSLSGHAVAADNVTVFAAASLTNALQDIIGQYEKNKHEIKIVTSYASSSTLARQIEQGAPADLFISADQQWMDYAAGKNSIEADSRYTLLGNDLVLIAPASEKAKPAERTAYRDRRPGPRSGRNLCERGLTKSWRVGYAVADYGARQQRPRGAGAGGTQRNALRHRVRFRRRRQP